MTGEGSSGCRAYNDYDLFQTGSSETALVKANTPSFCVLGKDLASFYHNYPPKLTSYTHTRCIKVSVCIKMTA